MVDDEMRARLIDAARRDRDMRARLAASGALFGGYHPEMEAVHVANAELLEEIIDVIGGWPTRKRFGDDGAGAAFAIAQHAISQPAFQRRALERLLEAAEHGEINPLDTAYLADRIAVFEGRAQMFGTQFDWDERGHLSPAAVADPGNLDERRANIGLPPIAEAIASMRASAAAEGETPPADIEQRRVDFDAWARRVGWRA